MPTTSESAHPKGMCSTSLLDGGQLMSAGEHKVYPRSAYPPDYRASSLCDPEEERSRLEWNHCDAPRASQPDDSHGKLKGTYSSLRLPSSASPQRAERVYARAILASLPQDARDPDWRDGVRGASGSSWDLYRLAEPESEVFRELERYSEVFGYLARLYQSALVLYSDERIEQIVRRGREILAAVRLLPHYPHVYRAPARGTDAPNSSQISQVGWKPARELALAEKVAERRRLRAETERAARRHARERPVTGSSVCSTASSALDTEASEPSTRAPSVRQNSLLIDDDDEGEKEVYGRRGAVSRADTRFLDDDAESSTDSDFRTCIDGGVEESHVHPSVTLKQPISMCRRDSIRWHIPEYDYDARDVPTMRLPEPMFDDGETEKRPLWLRRHMTKSPGTLTTPYFIRPSISGEISPLTFSPVTTDDTTAASTTAASTTPAESTPLTTPLSTTESTASTVFPETCTPTSSSSASPLHPETSKLSWHSSRSCQIKAALGKLPIPKLRRPAWRSNTESEASKPDKLSFGGIRRPRRTRPGIPFRAFSYQTTTSGETAPDDVDFITVRNDTVTTSEKVRHARGYSSTEEEPQPEYTRTEDEYQELANTVEQLRQELYEERQKNLSMRDRSVNRGRRPERDTVTNRGASRKNPFKRWLGGSEV